MQAEIETLLELQDRDKKIRDFSKQLERIPGEELAAKDRLQDDEQAVEKCRADIQSNEVEMKNLELDINTRNDSISKLWKQQFETRKNDEYQAMGCEVERHKDKINTLEDSELVLMEVGEEMKKKLKEYTSALEATQSLVDEELVELNSRHDSLNADLGMLGSERAKIVAGLNEDTVEVYDRLMKNKGDVGVVPLKQGQCSGCHVKVVSDTVVQAKAEKGLTHCENCGRIVYCVD